MKREENADRAKQLLRQSPLSRFELECKLGISQQRVSEAMRDLGARVIGHEPRDCRGHPMPIYSLEQPQESAAIRRVCSVWDLGSVS